MEHYEIVAYKSLLVLAEQADVRNASRLLTPSLHEEEDMAALINENLKSVILKYVAYQDRERKVA